MSNKTQLQTNNTNLDALITRVNTAKDTAASLPEAGGGSGINTCTVIIDVLTGIYAWKYACTAYESDSFVMKNSDFYDGVTSSSITLTNVVCGSVITVIDTSASQPFSSLDDPTMQWGSFEGGKCCFSAPLTAGVTATVNLQGYID